MQWLRTAWSQTSILQKGLIGLATLVLIGAASSVGGSGSASSSLAPSASTASATRSASASPSATPTASPSARATPTPTSATTSAPTPAPTPVPTPQPTSAPTPVPTAAPTPVPTPVPTATAAGFYMPPGWDGVSDVNCSDFDTHTHAQSFFIGTGGSPSNDPYRLDANHDGIACESLPG